MMTALTTVFNTGWLYTYPTTPFPQTNAIDGDALRFMRTCIMLSLWSTDVVSSLTGSGHWLTVALMPYTLPVLDRHSITQ